MTIHRHLNGDADELLESSGIEWQYDDPAEHDAAIELFLTCNVHMGDIDDWIEGRRWPDDEARTMAMDARDKVFAEWLAGDRHAAMLLAVKIDSLMRRDQLKQPWRLKKAARVRAGIEAQSKPAGWADKIRQAIEADPTASDRKIAKAAGTSPRTVARYRKK